MVFNTKKQALKTFILGLSAFSCAGNGLEYKT
jgi:hypothetical protein